MTVLACQDGSASLVLGWLVFSCFVGLGFGYDFNFGLAVPDVLFLFCRVGFSATPWTLTSQYLGCGFLVL